MAQSSGSFVGGVNNNNQRLRVEWTSTQNVETNSSTITANMWFDSAGAMYIGNRSDNHTIIDGTSKQWNSEAISQNGAFSILLNTVSQEIYHDSYGNKTFSMTSSFNVNYYSQYSQKWFYYITASSGNIELPNIPRASTITVNDANIGSSTTININKKVSSFTTELYWKVQGDNNWTYIDNTSQYSYGWTVPTSLYQRIPNSRTITCEFRAITLSGSTTIGEKTTTATFRATGDPIINSVTIKDTNTGVVNVLTHNADILVKYLSTAKISVEAEAQNSATIRSVRVNDTYATYNSTTQKWELSIQKVETNSFVVVVEDSRVSKGEGYTNTDTFTVTMVDYVPLTINATLTRNQPTDGKINISINGNYFNGRFGTNGEINTLTIKYRYIEQGGTYQNNWVTLTPTITDNTYTLTTQLSNFDYTKQYEFQVRAIDQPDVKTIIGIVVTKGQPVYNWGENFFNINGELRINNVPINFS